MTCCSIKIHHANFMLRIASVYMGMLLPYSMSRIINADITIKLAFYPLAFLEDFTLLPINWYDDFV